ncbi:MAG: DUF4340 domain-containing protein [Spirochaetota bacterium]
MKKSVRLIIFAAVIVLLLGAYGLIKTKPFRKTDSGKSTETAQIKLSSAEKDNIVSMTLSQGDKTVKFEKKDTGWKLAYPELDKIDNEKIGDIADAFSDLRAERVIEESPSDLDQYGLGSNRAQAEAELKDGSKIIIFIGDKTPTGFSFYAQTEGDKKVYTISSYNGSRLMPALDTIRVTEIGKIDKQKLEYFKLIKTGARTIELVPKKPDLELPGTQFSALVMIKPYKRPRGIDAQAFGELSETIPSAFNVNEFVDDNPKDLSIYGLDNPKYQLFLRDADNSFQLLIGAAKDDDNYFVKLPDENRVYTMSAYSLKLLEAAPFKVTDKFALLVNIDDVDRLEIKRTDKIYTAEIHRTKKKNEQGEEETEAAYTLNGKTVEEQPFKEFYQKVIGFLVDAENPNPEKKGKTEITIRFFLNTPWKTAEMELIPYDRDFYAVQYSDGSREFLLSRYQVENMLKSLEALTQ